MTNEIFKEQQMVDALCVRMSIGNFALLAIPSHYVYAYFLSLP